MPKISLYFKIWSFKIHINFNLTKTFSPLFQAVIDPDHSYHWRWTNPAGFDGPHLRVPIRMQEGAFSDSVWTKIVGDMKKMSDYVGGCIEFYDDTV